MSYVYPDIYVESLKMGLRKGNARRAAIASGCESDHIAHSMCWGDLRTCPLCARRICYEDGAADDIDGAIPGICDACAATLILPSDYDKPTKNAGLAIAAHPQPTRAFRHLPIGTRVRARIARGVSRRWGKGAVAGVSFVVGTPEYLIRLADGSLRSVQADEVTPVRVHRKG